MNNQPRSHGAETFGTVSEAPPDSHLSRRKPSHRGFSALDRSRRDDSAPPTQPSIAPPSPVPAPRGASPLETAAAFHALEVTRSPFSYRLLLALFAVAITIAALGSLLPSAWGLAGSARIAWVLAAGVLIACLTMSALITFSFARRLEALARAAERFVPAEERAQSPDQDAVASLAHTLATLTRRVELLQAELEQCVEEEQARVDELVRERTREFGVELADHRRALGSRSALLSMDRDGTLLGQAPSVVGEWLGSVPHTKIFWHGLEQASRGAGERFEAAWRAAWNADSTSPRLDLLPHEVEVGGRTLGLSYQLVTDESKGAPRVLVVLREVTPVQEPRSQV